MMKKQLWKSIFRIGLPVALVMGIIAILILASQNAELSLPEKKPITPIELNVDPDLKDAMQKMAENSDFILYANMKKAIISLEEKRSGAVWYSMPEALVTQEKIQGSSNMLLSSLIGIRYANRDNNATLQNAMAGSVNKNTMNARRIQNGVRFDFYFSGEGFLIPVTITLTENGLKAEVLSDEIVSADEQLKLTEVIVLPGFGAAPEDTQGYMFVPDESGMLIPFGKRLSSYSGRVYGADLAVTAKTKSKEESVMRLPVFGMKQGDKAFVAIITQGDGRAGISAITPGQKYNYSSVYSSFIYRESLLVNVSQKTFETTQANMFEKSPTGLKRFSVEYRVPAQKDYVGMANTYRQYLIEEKHMEPIKKNKGLLQLEVIGGVTRRESVLGVPMDRVVPVTGYQAVSDIASQYGKLGISQISISYLHWAKNASDKRLSSDLKAERALGGQTALREMLDKETARGNEIFLELNMTDMMAGQWGYNPKYDAAQSVQQEPAIQYSYLMSTYQVDPSADLVYLLSPNQLDRTFKAFSKQRNRLTPYGWAPSSLGNKLYSDFGKGGLDRGLAVEKWEQVLREIRGFQDELLLSTPCAYAVPYATVIQDVPLCSGGSLAAAQDVPFYSIALHGLVEMSTPAINAEASVEKTVLKALENGISLKVALGCENIEKLKNTRLASYSYIEQDRWIEKSVEAYKSIEPYLKKVESQAVQSHEQLQAGVYQTVFENGVGVVVNYNDYPVSVSGQEINALGYRPIRW